MAELNLRFTELFDGEHSVTLTPQWIAEYRARRKVPTFLTAVLEQTAVARPAPRPVQSLALNELDRLRADGESRALVVAATGLGKTYLAAFDSAHAERVLFIAHRQELLLQAAEAYRNLYPERSLGFVMDGTTELDRDCVFASIQSLGNALRSDGETLKGFDYVVIDEFHHAAADSYQRVLERITPSFLLGLTATPFRGDNRDLLALCHGNLAYQVGLFDAIAFGWLVPFRYYGIADTVEYTDELLSTSKTYDTTKLTIAFNTPERAELALERFRGHPSRAALGFCVSIEHADFMTARFAEAGIACAAVHSGPASADRRMAIEQLRSGDLALLFVVDMFNEGVDLPPVDLVMFLRPTESMTVFLQQLGRGLRLHQGKGYLTVLDFIGNYRMAHVKLPLLAGMDPEGDGSPTQALRALQRWQDEGVRPDGLPEGIEVHLEAVALSQLQSSLRSASPLRELVVEDLIAVSQRFARPPSLLEWQKYGRFSLATARTALAVDRWAEALSAANICPEDQTWLDREVGSFLREIERTTMTKSFKMVVLLAMCAHGAFSPSIGLGELVRYFRGHFTEEAHRLDVGGTPVEDAANVADSVWEGYLLANPINAWIGGNRAQGERFFQWSADRRSLVYVGPRPAGRDEAERLFHSAVVDRAMFRLAQYWGRPGPGRFVYKVIPLGSAEEPTPARDVAETKDQSICIMFGSERSGLPMGWHPVRINGRFLYGKFVKVALNVLKATPSDDRQVPNELSQELRKLLAADSRRHPAQWKVRLVPLPGEAAWEIVAA